MATTVATWPTRHEAENKRQASVFEPLKELFKMVALGCFHRNMSRPFTSGRQTHRVCTSCGARRRFDPDRWEMYGSYFFAAETPGNKEHERTRRTLPGDKSNVCVLRAA
jgi:hypothetical protein